MKSVVLAVPGDIDTVSGGYAYDRQLMSELRRQDLAVRHLALIGNYPRPSPNDITAAHEAFAAIDDGTPMLVDGLALAVLPEVAARHAARLPLVALIHHPLALETGLDAATAARLEKSEREALAHCREVVVTSPETGRILVADFGVAPEHLSVALPGTAPGARARGGNTPPHIVSVASLIPRKGHDLLIEALHRNRDLDWRATLTGSDTADAAWARRLGSDIERLGLRERIALTGPRADARSLMATGDIFALPSRYEGYGMVFAEAMAQGLPILACAGGAVPDVVPDTAGILVPVGNVDALTEALRRLLTDHGLRERLASGAFEAGKSLPAWHETAAVVAAALDKAVAAAGIGKDTTP